MASRNQLEKRANELGISFTSRISDEGLQKKIDEATATNKGGTGNAENEAGAKAQQAQRTNPNETSQKAEGGPQAEPGTSSIPGEEGMENPSVSPDHWPAQSVESSNEHGEEVEADVVAEAKNADGRTNEVDYVKNTGPGPGNPDQRHTDPRKLMEGRPERVEVIAEPPVDNDGNPLQTEETPKVIHETVSVSGNREIDSNILPDMNERSPLVVKANELNIRVDPNWDDDRLRAEIQMAREGRADLQVKGAVPPAEYGKVDYDDATSGDKRVSVGLTADVWEDDGNGGTRRVYADSDEGRNYKTDRKTAQKLLDTGKAKRTDPLP